MVSISKKNIENVFLDTLKTVSNGGKPNIEKNMLKHGYSMTSARSHKVVSTKTWEQLKRKYLRDELALQTFNDLAQSSNDDKDNRLKASVEIMKLNDRYPAQRSKVLGLFSTLDSLEEDSGS